MRNQLAKDLSNKDFASAKRTISAGIFSNLAIALLLFAVGAVVINFVDFKWLYGIKDDIVSNDVLLWSTFLVFVGIIIRFFLNTVTSIFYALQKASVNNFLMLLVSTLQLLFVLLFKASNPSNALLLLSGSYIFFANAPLLIAGIIVFCGKLKECKPNIKYINKIYIKKVLNIGVVFFLCQIFYMLLISSNELIISNLYGPEYTTDFSFYYKLSSVISMVVTLATTPLWSLITKALNEKQYKWLMKLYRIMSFGGLATIILQFAFIPIEQFVMDIWLKEESIKVNYVIAIAFACFGSVFVYQTILSTIVCGLGRMKLQLFFYLGGIIAKALLVFLFYKISNDWSLVIWTNVIVLLPYCVAQQIDLSLFFRKRIREENALQLEQQML